MKSPHEPTLAWPAVTTVTQGGLTLAELLVAMALSSVLLLGASRFLQTALAQYQQRESLAEHEADARHALWIIDQRIALAGYRHDPEQPLPEAFPASQDAECHFAAGQVLAPALAGGLCLRYQLAHGQDRDCLGRAPPALPGLEQPYARLQGAAPSRRERLWLQGEHLLCSLPGLSATLAGPIAALEWRYGSGTAEHPWIDGFSRLPAADRPIRAVAYRVTPASSADSFIARPHSGLTLARNLLP